MRRVIRPVQTNLTTPATQRRIASTRCRFRLLPRSLAPTEGIPFGFFSSGYLDGSVPQVSLPSPIYSAYGCYAITRSGLPHSVIRGSQDVCSSPRLFAAYHDLLRQIAPRHPPWTRSRLTISSTYVALSLIRGPHHSPNTTVLYLLFFFAVLISSSCLVFSFLRRASSLLRTLAPSSGISSRGQAFGSLL